jgi:prophage regulatory protein
MAFARGKSGAQKAASFSLRRAQNRVDNAVSEAAESRAASEQAMSSTTPHLMRLPEVEHATGLRRSTIYDLIRAGQFPRPVKLSRLSAWPESEVSAWISKRVAVRDGAQQ